MEILRATLQIYRDGTSHDLYISDDPLITGTVGFLNGTSQRYKNIQKLKFVLLDMPPTHTHPCACMNRIYRKCIYALCMYVAINVDTTDRCFFQRKYVAVVCSWVWL